MENLEEKQKTLNKKERILNEAIEKLNSMAAAVTTINHNISDLSHKKNQLISEKEATEQKYQELLREHYSLKEQLEKINKDVNDKFDKQTQFNQKVDELNQETENLIGEIDKWQT